MRDFAWTAIAFLVGLAIVGLVVYGVRLLLPLFGFPAAVEQLIWVLLIIAMLALFLGWLYRGGWPSPPP